MAQEAKRRRYQVMESLVARKDSGEYTLVIELLRLMYEEAKEAVVEASSEQLVEAQGYARAYRDLLRDFSMHEGMAAQASRSAASSAHPYRT